MTHINSLYCYRKVTPKQAYMALRGPGGLRSGHTENEMPRRTAICARGGKDFELYCGRLHHPRQTEGELTRRTSLVRGGQRRVVYCLQICLAVSREWRKYSLKKVREYVFLYDTGHPEYKNLVKKPAAWRDITEELVSLCFLHIFIYKRWYIINSTVI
jgi:hypothetical protein